MDASVPSLLILIHMLLPKLDNNTWSTLAIESVLIVLSVILGFLVTEWRQTQENEDLAQTAKENVLSEIESNYGDVMEAQLYHITLRDTLQSLDDPTPETVSRIVSSGFILSNGSQRAGIVSPANVLGTAWTTAQTTGAIRYLDLGDIQMLSSVYEAQDSYRQHRNWFGQAFMATTLQQGAVGLLGNYRNFDIVLAQFASQEQQLLGAYERVLQHFDRTPPSGTLSVERPAAPGGLPAR